VSDVELTELQTRIYDLVKEKGTISKKNIAKHLDMQLRSVASPIKSMLDSGVLVEDEYGEYTIAAGVREELEDGFLSVPSASINDQVDDEATRSPGNTSVSDDGAYEGEDDEDDLYSEYWRKHPEELVTYYQEEGLDALKKHALQAALENTPGVGKKALNSALHWFDIDEDVRRDPTALMRALEDAGVKHTVVGRVVRETFLPEKQYSRYLRPETDIIIDRGRPNASPHRHTVPTMRQRYSDRGAMYEDEYEYSPHVRSTTRHRDDEPPAWARHIMSRLDAIEMRGSPSHPTGGKKANIVIEPVLDENGNPVPDPNNPGQYLERKIVYEPDQTMAQPRTSVPQQDKTVEELRAELSRMRELLADHETERKISSAVTPLLDKINNLEKRNPAAKAGMSDAQFKMITEKEIFQDISTSVENTVSNVIEPLLEGLTEVQKMQAMREIIELERQDNVPPGTYLKYMSGGGGGEGETITKDRVGGALNMIKNKTKGVM